MRRSGWPRSSVTNSASQSLRVRGRPSGVHSGARRGIDDRGHGHQRRSPSVAAGEVRNARKLCRSDSTWARTAWSPCSPAKSRWVRVPGRRSRRPSPKSSDCRSIAFASSWPTPSNAPTTAARRQPNDAIDGTARAQRSGRHARVARTPRRRTVGGQAVSVGDQGRRVQRRRRQAIDTCGTGGRQVAAAKLDASPPGRRRRSHPDEPSGACWELPSRRSPGGML